MVDHHLLAGMQCAIITALQPLDRCYRCAFQHAHELNTGIDRMPAHSAIALPPGHHHRTGTAIALAAPLLRARQTSCLAKPVQQRRVPREAADLFDPVVENECDPVTHRRANPAPRQLPR